jgi:diketogulonate reductase-like aldo/keto reductase
MSENNIHITRRTFILGTGAMAAAVAFAPIGLLGETRTPIRRPIHSTGEQLPVLGMGTWRTFDAEPDAALRDQLAEVIRIFFDNGGTLIDSSPMYGRSESMIGELLNITGHQNDIFAATKVWTDGRQAGIDQMRQSMQRMGVEVMDLMQIHNLRDWQTHLPVLREWKEQGRIRYIGITTSHGRYHDEFEQLMKTHELDFVQFTYNLESREAEDRLLPLAADRGIATLINRPFGQGDLFRKVRDRPLPEWSTEFDCRSWGQYFLKYIVSHPAVTCVIPATSRAHHMEDNMQAGFGRLPDAALRKRMEAFHTSL